MTWLSVVLLALAAWLRPDRAHCPPRGWWLDEGVRADGSFSCAWPSPERWVGHRDVSEDSRVSVEGKVYCTGGTKPIEVRGVEVGCQPGGWR